ncbi:terpenoid cyclases/protein prenyltransferase alpha-alpha toroid [Hypoxylon rubiginosum]|uniref:Terpenoid cyclases/protein prenyltransferase alpha-alpha toroid n=1 Tax=Hypoxylon rubiginosum TaxID=110542 RepID=A0ACC0DD38_9PEZI|nr:terpenoid cyclases/protein prenyltransferase alpha-alpha toroid [Hypoxylon rubiginosum]
MEQPLYLSQASVALERAAQFSFDCQQSDGHWVAEVSADVTFTSEYVMFKYAVGLDLKSDGDALCRWLLQDQKEDGSWGLAPELEGNVSTTTEAYLALKILGVSSTHKAMIRAKDFMVRNGGVAKVRFFTRFFLATFGLFPWVAIPQLPAELILMPPSSPLNIYTLSSWARSTLIPILLVHHHQPVYALPNGLSHDNDFLDELWVDPSNKNVPFAPPLSDLFWQQEWIKFGFTAIDKVIAQLGGLRQQPLRKVARKKCVEWLLEHQEGTGEWAGFFPPMHGSIWALLLEGFPLNHEVIRLGLVGLDGLAVEDGRGKRIAATVSPVWDTALMAGALCEAGYGPDTRILKAVNWIKRKQIFGPQGDWRVYSRNTQAGGWSFEYHNTWYPDVDDTAVVIMTLVAQDPGLITSESISSSVEWILGMQNHDGGWAAFDTNNDKLWLHKIPFSDMDSLCDPSSADITGRILECFGFLLAQRKGRLDIRLEKKVITASWRGISYLIKEQEASGAWWGRWGNNYIYGTSNVLRGMVYFARRDSKVREIAVRALRWFESIQNPDGGWGETLKSYDFPELAGKGVSTAAQTAWALEALLPYNSASKKCIEDGIKWLIDNQTITSENGASWPTDVYTGTGFPNVLYLGYPYYHHAFPIKALSQYIQSKERTELEHIIIPRSLDVLCRPDVVMMVSGSRGDISPFLRIGTELQRSYGCRVRIASHLSHRKAIEGQGFELYPIAGSPDEFAKIFTEKPDILRSFVRGDFSALLTLFKRMLEDCLRSAIGSSRVNPYEKAMSQRPFIADIVISNPPTLAHSHVAEALQIPSLLVSIQPTLPTSSFPHPLTMSKPKLPQACRWNYLSYWGLELAYVPANFET